MRPGKQGKDPGYALSDPGAEYIPGLTETWLGPLAALWGVEGQRATLEARTNLFNCKTPDGSREIPLHVAPKNYRPVHGVNSFAGKSLNAWIAGQEPEARERAERLFVKCVVETLKADVLPHLASRVGKGGTSTVPTAALATVHKHVTDSAGHYCLHAYVEVHNVGRCPDGKERAVDNTPLFTKQRMNTMFVESRVAHAFHKEFGLVLRHGPVGTLEVKGLEALRPVKTPRQQQMIAEMLAAKVEPTPAARHWAARKTHLPRDPLLTVAAAVTRTRTWAQAAGVNARAAAVDAARGTSELYEQVKAEKAVRRAVKAVDRIGQRVSREELRAVALCEGVRARADPARVDALVTKAAAAPARHGLVRLADGHFSTKGVEQARASWGASLEKLGRKAATPPTQLALDRLHLRERPPAAYAAAKAADLGRSRVAVVDAPSESARAAVDGYRAAGRRVFAVGPGRTAGEVQRLAGTPPEAVEAFARRLGKTPLPQTVRELRRHRWRSADHLGALIRQARRPAVRLERSDVLVLDARHASHRALKDIAAHARRAKATVIVIHEGPLRPEPLPDRGRPGRGRG